MCPREELNFHLILRSDLFYPLNYEGSSSPLLPYYSGFLVLFNPLHRVHIMVFVKKDDNYRSIK